MHEFLGRFVVYPTKHAQIAHTLWIAHTFVMDAWESTPRIAFLSPEPASGKTRALEVTELLVPNPVEAINVTPAYLFRKVGTRRGRRRSSLMRSIPSLVRRPKTTKIFAALLNAGHRRGAVAGRCVTRGKFVETVEYPGLLRGRPRRSRLAARNHPDPLDRHADASTRTGRTDSSRSDGEYCIREGDRDSQSARRLGQVRRRPSYGELAGDPGRHHRPRRRRVGADYRAGRLRGWGLARARQGAAVALVKAGKEASQASGFGSWPTCGRSSGITKSMTTSKILAELLRLDEAPWADLKGKALDNRGLANRLRKYEVRSANIRDDAGVVLKGYKAADLYEAWRRYLPPQSDKSATSATSATDSENSSDSTPFVAGSGKLIPLQPLHRPLRIPRL